MSLWSKRSDGRFRAVVITSEKEHESSHRFDFLASSGFAYLFEFALLVVGFAYDHG
jgi:hypothetical protein